MKMDTGIQDFMPEFKKNNTKLIYKKFENSLSLLIFKKTKLLNKNFFKLYLIIVFDNKYYLV